MSERRITQLFGLILGALFTCTLVLNAFAFWARTGASDQGSRPCPASCFLPSPELSHQPSTFAPIGCAHAWTGTLARCGRAAPVDAPWTPRVQQNMCSAAKAGMAAVTTFQASVRSRSARVQRRRGTL